LLSARKQLDVITAYRKVGTYRGAAEMCGVTHKTVKRIIEKDRAAAERVERRKNYESVRALVATEIDDTKGKISAKRLLPTARAAGYAGSDRNFRRLVAQERSKYRQQQARERSRRPAVWTPGEHLVIDWGVLNGLHVFCAVLAWSRVRFVRFADNERADTTLALLAECFATLDGVPKVVLADRMGCLKGGVVADVVVPTPHYVRFATHYRFRPDFCHARDPQSKGIVENLVNYAKYDLMVPLGALGGAAGQRITDLQAANTAAAAWCAEVNAARHSEIAGGPRAAPGRGRTRPAGPVAVAAAGGAVRRPAGAAQGRQAVLRPVRLGPLLGPEPDARRDRRGAGRQHRHHDRSARHRGGAGHPPADGAG
jgi:transposase